MEKGLPTKRKPGKTQETLSIKKSTYYRRLKYLEIEPSKDAERTYFNAEQVKLMDLQENGTLGAIPINGSSPGLREGLDKKPIHLSLNTYSPYRARKWR
jgi:hypothetical protein